MLEIYFINEASITQTILVIFCYRTLLSTENTFKYTLSVYRSFFFFFCLTFNTVIIFYGFSRPPSHFPKRVLSRTVSRSHRSINIDRLLGKFRGLCRSLFETIPNRSKRISAGLIEGISRGSPGGEGGGREGNGVDRVVVNFRRHVSVGQPKEINCPSSPRFSSGR